MDHTEEIHRSNVNSLCRTCGGRSLKRRDIAHKTRVSCDNFKNDLLLYYGVNIDLDNEGEHSQSLCKQCVDRIYRLRRDVREATLSTAKDCVTHSQNIWSKYNITLTFEECSVCYHYRALGKGSVKTKRHCRRNKVIHGII